MLPPRCSPLAASCASLGLLLFSLVSACTWHPGAKVAPGAASPNPSGVVKGPGSVVVNGAGGSGTAPSLIAGTPYVTFGAVDTSSCDSLGTATSLATTAPAMRSLTNAEYATSVQDLLQTNVDASLSLPSDDVKGGFDTSAAHAFTSTLASAYLTTAQQIATAYVSGTAAPCASQGFAQSCTTEALLSLAARAYRRPLTADEQAPLSALVTTLTANGTSAQAAFSAGVAAVLISPQFIYQAQVTADAGLAHPDQLALATRLSYVLWSSVPDATLIGLAQAGQLSDRSILSAQIERLLADPKAAAFGVNFAGQWLGTRYLAGAPAASQVDPALLAAFSAETQAYFGEFLQKNLNVRGLLDGGFSYINVLLADHYKIPEPSADGLTRVGLDGVQRLGLLTQGSFLLQTSDPDNTSPVKRGKWILDNILCAPPPPPPNGVAAALAADNQSLPMRDRLAQHRASPACAGCHVLMDPVGLGFENYDLSGQWRLQDSLGLSVDASGTLPNGGTFTGPAQLVQLLKADPAFPRCVATKLATYALGRAPSVQEQCRIRKIADQSSSDSYGLKSLLLDLSLALLVH